MIFYCFKAWVQVSDFLYACCGRVIFINVLREFKGFVAIIILLVHRRKTQKISSVLHYLVIQRLLSYLSLILLLNVMPLHSSLQDRKSTRLNSSHVSISYAVFCLKKKKQVHTCTLC